MLIYFIVHHDFVVAASPLTAHTDPVLAYQLYIIVKTCAYNNLRHIQTILLKVFWRLRPIISDACTETLSL